MLELWVAYSIMATITTNLFHLFNNDSNNDANDSGHDALLLG